MTFYIFFAKINDCEALRELIESLLISLMNSIAATWISGNPAKSIDSL